MQLHQSLAVYQKKIQTQSCHFQRNIDAWFLKEPLKKKHVVKVFHILLVETLAPKYFKEDTY